MHKSYGKESHNGIRAKICAKQVCVLQIGNRIVIHMRSLVYCYQWKLEVAMHVRFTRRQILALQLVLHIMEPHRMYCNDGIHFAGVLYTWQPSCRQTG